MLVYVCISWICCFLFLFRYSVSFLHLAAFSLTALLPACIYFNTLSSLKLSDLALATLFAYPILFLSGYLIVPTLHMSMFSSKTLAYNKKIFITFIVLLFACVCTWMLTSISKSPASSLINILLGFDSDPDQSSVLRSTLLKESDSIPLLRSVAVASWDVISPLAATFTIHSLHVSHRQNLSIFKNIVLLLIVFGMSLFFGERYAVFRVLCAYFVSYFYFSFFTNNPMQTHGVFFAKLKLARRNIFSICILISIGIAVACLLPIIHYLTYSQSDLLGSSIHQPSFGEQLSSIVLDRVLGLGQVVEYFNRFDFTSKEGLLLGSGMQIPILYFIGLQPDFVNVNSLIHYLYSPSATEGVIGGAPAFWLGDMYVNFGFASFGIVMCIGGAVHILDSALRSISTTASSSEFSMLASTYLFTSWSLYLADFSVGFIPFYHDFRFFFLVMILLMSRYAVTKR